MSPGNLYRYFPSKEALIAGICERNRAEAAESFLAVDRAPDFFEGLAALAHYHLVERPEVEADLCAEIMAESRRNPEIARLQTESSATSRPASSTCCAGRRRAARFPARSISMPPPPC